MNRMKLIATGIQRIAQKLPLNSSTEIRLTHLCTQRCRQCRVYERTTEPPYMSLEQFQMIAERLRNYGAYIGFISGGEATLVPDLEPILIEAKKTFRIATTLVTGLYNRPEVIQRIGAVALANGINIQTSLDGMGELGDSLRGVTTFYETILGHMSWLSQQRNGSKSLLYANIVLNDLNLDQVPELIHRACDLGWKTTIGLYHTLTDTTRSDDELRLRPGKRLDKVLKFLDHNPDIMNLNSFIEGIENFILGKQRKMCAFVDSPVLSTRTTIMENGAVHLCYGEPIGNILQDDLATIFKSESYLQRIDQYRGCQGCWTTCYTQRYLLTHPASLAHLIDNFRKVRGLKPEQANHGTSKTAD